jgi:hypothetical protein
MCTTRNTLVGDKIGGAPQPGHRPHQRVTRPSVTAHAPAVDVVVTSRGGGSRAADRTPGARECAAGRLVIATLCGAVGGGRARDAGNQPCGFCRNAVVLIGDWQIYAQISSFAGCSE